MVSKGTAELELCLVTPSKRRAIASFSCSHVEISASAIADVVDKPRGSRYQTLSWFHILWLGEGQLSLFHWLWELHLMNLVLGE